MEFLAGYAGFLARTATILAAILIVVFSVAMLRSRERRSGGQLEVHKHNDFYKSLRERLQDSVLDKNQLKTLRKEEAKAEKAEKKAGSHKPRVYVLDFDGDIRASAGEVGS